MHILTTHGGNNDKFVFNNIEETRKVHLSEILPEPVPTSLWLLEVLVCYYYVVYHLELGQLRLWQRALTYIFIMCLMCH